MHCKKLQLYFLVLTVFFLLFCCFMVASFCGLSGNREINMMMITMMMIRRVLNGLLQLIGAVLLSIGIWVLIMKQDYESVHDALFSPTVLAIAVGAVMVLTAVLGVVAAAASKLWPLRIVRSLTFASMRRLQPRFD